MAATFTNLTGFEEPVDGQNFGAFAAEFSQSFNIEDEDSDAFEKLEAGSNIGGLVVPIQFTDHQTGQVTDIWGSIDTAGLFDIIDGSGKTHPLMHPMALDACLKIATDWNWVDRNQAHAIASAHQMLTTQLHTPHISTMLDGTKVAQVMVGFAQMAQRFKTGAYGAMAMNSQGDFLKYVGHLEIMGIMTQAAAGNPKLQGELAELIMANRQIISKMAGELDRPQVTAVASKTIELPRNVASVESRPTVPPPTHKQQAPIKVVAPAPTRPAPRPTAVAPVTRVAKATSPATSVFERFSQSYTPGR